MFALQPDVDTKRVYEARIGLYLGAGEAIYSRKFQHLYFCDTQNLIVSTVLSAVYSGRRQTLTIQPVLMDQLRFFEIAKKVELDYATFKVVNAALTISGVKVKAEPPRHILEN